MELDREECISELDTKIKYAKFANTNSVVLSSKAAQFCLEHAQYYEQKIKKLTEENDAWQKRLISTEEKADKAYYELACEVEDLRTENANLHASCTEFERKCVSLNDENERLRAELEKRPPRLVITKL